MNLVTFAMHALFRLLHMTCAASLPLIVSVIVTPAFPQEIKPHTSVVQTVDSPITVELFSANGEGSTLCLERCAVCHGADAKGTGPLAQKSNPPTPDLTSATFKARLSDYPGVIVSSVILRPNGNLIPKTLRENGITLPAHTWTDKELRDLNEYMTHLILKN